MRPLGRPTVDKMIIIIIIWFLERQSVNWIDLAQYRVQWQAFVNMVINLWVP